MANIFIFHGIFGHPKENWYDWLKIKLEEKGHKVIVPKFPTPEDQTLENWMKVLFEYKEFINKDSIFIGHSLGVAFALSVLEEIKINKAYFISGFIGKIGNEFDPINAPLVGKDFKWDLIKSNCNSFTMIHSDTDPYVKIEKAIEIATHLEVNIILVPNAGHFNEAAGYTKFEMLLNLIVKPKH
jgi:predicted alpha/beta hydrolase family esterase